MKGELTKEQAIAIHDSGVWREWNHEQIVRFQLFQKRLAVPFGRFHEAMEAVLGRSVFTHEFADDEALILEYLGEKHPPTIQEIIQMIPKDKRFIIDTNIF